MPSLEPRVSERNASDSLFPYHTETQSQQNQEKKEKFVTTTEGVSPIRLRLTWLLNVAPTISSAIVSVNTPDYESVVRFRRANVGGESCDEAAASL
jgi:hypothetical protein